jgi:hypothetical protein
MSVSLDLEYSILIILDFFLNLKSKILRDYYIRRDKTSLWSVVRIMGKIPAKRNNILVIIVRILTKIESPS